MEQEQFDQIAKKNLPENFDQIVTDCKETFEEFFLLGVVDSEKGIAFTSAAINGVRIAGVFAEMCKKNPLLLVQFLALMQSNQVKAADVSHIDSVLNDPIIFTDQ